MSEKQNWIKKYIKGNAKSFKLGASGSEIINVSIDMDDLVQDFDPNKTSIPSHNIKKAGNGKHYLNFTISPLKNGEDQFGNTHSLFFSYPEGEAPQKSGGKKDGEDWDF